MLSFDEAQRKLLALAWPLPAERVGIDEACGRVLAESVRAPFDLPPFDHSAMDGYALCVADLVGVGPWMLPVRGESRTGGTTPPLEPATTCRIFTGATMPVGADAVVMQEHVERGDASATFRTRPLPGAHVRRRGEDLTKGAVTLAPGVRLGPSHVGLAAASDRAWLLVSRRPAVTILGTGDELRPPGSGAREGTIPESNAFAIRAIARNAGASARIAPTVPDDEAATEKAIHEALVATDVLITIGGVSVGTHDLVRPALERLGVALDFWKVAIKPGKPLVVGRRGATIVLGLPGNPASATVTFALFGVPLLRAMQGDARPMPHAVPARLGHRVKREPGRTEFLWANVTSEGGALVATPLVNQASGAVTTMAEANALIVVSAERGAVEVDERVSVLWMRELGA